MLGDASPLLAAHTWGPTAATLCLGSSMQERAEFLASFPAIQSAIKVGQDGARIQLDIPETELPNALRLLQWRDRVLRVIVEPEE